jgi:hypothetical protein
MNYRKKRIESYEKNEENIQLRKERKEEQV